MIPTINPHQAHKEIFYTEDEVKAGNFKNSGKHILTWRFDADTANLICEIESSAFRSLEPGQREMFDLNHQACKYLGIPSIHRDDEMDAYRDEIDDLEDANEQLTKENASLLEEIEMLRTKYVVYTLPKE